MMSMPTSSACFGPRSTSLRVARARAKPRMSAAPRIIPGHVAERGSPSARGAVHDRRDGGEPQNAGTRESAPSVMRQTTYGTAIDAEHPPPRFPACVCATLSPRCERRDRREPTAVNVTDAERDEDATPKGARRIFPEVARSAELVSFEFGDLCAHVAPPASGGGGGVGS